MTGISTNGGDVNITVNQKISAGGLVGAGGISVGGSGHIVVNAPIDPPLIGVHHLELGARAMGDDLSLRGQVARQHEDQPAKGVHILVIFGDGKGQAGLGLHI